MVWTFGDSFTQGCNADLPQNFVDFTYGDIIASSLAQHHTKVAHYGSTMNDIFMALTRYFTKISEEDIVIIGCTTPVRVPFPTQYQHSFENFHNRKGTHGTLTGLSAGHLDVDGNYIRKHYLPAVSIEKSNKINESVINFHENIIAPHIHHYEHYYDTWITYWLDVFKERGTKFYWWTPELWYPEKKYQTSCQHWTQEYHEIFAKGMLNFIKSTDYGQFTGRQLEGNP